MKISRLSKQKTNPPSDEARSLSSGILWKMNVEHKELGGRGEVPPGVEVVTRMTKVIDFVVRGNRRYTVHDERE